MELLSSRNEKVEEEVRVIEVEPSGSFRNRKPVKIYA
jgi:hypothetical protein